MPTGCCVKYCRNNADNTRNLGISYHKFPRNEEIRRKWILFCGQDKISKQSRMCSGHFKRTDFQRDLRNELTGNPTRNLLKDNAIPSLLFGDEKEYEPEIGNQQMIENILREYEDEKRRRSSEIATIIEKSLENKEIVLKDECINYEEMYYQLLQEHNALLSDHQKLKEETFTFKQKIEELESEIKSLVKNSPSNG